MADLATRLHEIAAEIDAAFDREPWRDQSGVGYVEIQFTRDDAEELRRLAEDYRG